MKSISKLKDEARKHEQREEWEKAIQAYLQVLKIADEGEAEVELPLYNRLGDLCVRLGRPQEAVRHYEQAADRYAEAGLYNNAIALCNKALRYSPDRLELIRKLGQFSASQGFITDARRYFLDYAERQFKAGKVSEALTALEDFANVSDDPEIREMLGRQLQAHGRTIDAVEELRRAHAMRVAAGDTAHAETLRQEILTIDPHAAIDGVPPATKQAPAREASPSELPGLVEIESADAETFDIASYEEPSGDAVPGLESGALPGDDVGAIELEGFETTDSGLSDIDLSGVGGGIEGLESTALDFGEVEEDASAIADLGIERDESSFDDGAGRDAETFDLPEDGAYTTDLPLLGDDEDSGFDLPLLGDGPGLDEEPTPLAPPQLDDTASLDLPAADEAPLDLPPADDAHDPLAGDLRIDLSSLGGFTFPAADETEAQTLESAPDDTLVDAAWDSATDVDLPALEEPDTSVETEPEPLDVAFDVESPAASFDAIAEARSVADADEVIDIPAIELPTWETDPAVEPAEDGAEGYEAAWVETTGSAEDESVTDLPTFAYEDEETPETEAIEDEDPLGLAAHLAGQVPAAAPVADAEPVSPPVVEPAPPAPPVIEPEPQAPPVVEPEPLLATSELEDTTPTVAGGYEAPVFDDVEAAPVEAAPGEAGDDWLDEIADDEPAPWEEPVEPAEAEPLETAIEDVTAAAAAAEQSAREMKQAGPPRARAEEGFIDLGALISGDEDEKTTRFRVEETAPTGDEDRDFAELLSQFKSKVSEHLPPEDAAAHYDLGLAFKEMGLVDEAISEFQIALRAGHMRLKVYEELGQCFLQKEQYNIAEKVLTRALDMSYEDELELLGVYYHLGRAYEALGRRDQARDAYERVLGMDINFEDVTARLARL